jgi:hypothetical protein
MEWDPWFAQGDWGGFQQPLQQRKTIAKEFAKQRAASKPSYIASAKRERTTYPKIPYQTYNTQL